MGSGKGPTKRGNKVRTPIAGKQSGVSVKDKTVNLPMAKAYGMMDIYQDDHLPALQPKGTKVMTDRMDR
jgi:hypothetical protein